MFKYVVSAKCGDKVLYLKADGTGAEGVTPQNVAIFYTYGSAKNVAKSWEEHLGNGAHATVKPLHRLYKD